VGRGLGEKIGSRLFTTQTGKFHGNHVERKKGGGKREKPQWASPCACGQHALKETKTRANSGGDHGLGRSVFKNADGRLAGGGKGGRKKQKRGLKSKNEKSKHLTESAHKL